MENSDGVKTILKALDSIWHEVSHAPKDGRNDFHGYDYTSELGFLKVLRPALLNAGLILIPSGTEYTPIDSNGNVFVTVSYTLAHKDGYIWPEKITAFGCGNDRAKNGNVGDKGIYKALTGANKYLLFKLFQIATGDDPEKNSSHDEDATSKTTQTTKPAPKPRATTETAHICPECAVPAIIKGKEEYGGGWLCYKKKGGCGAKFKDTAFPVNNKPEHPQDDIPFTDNTAPDVKYIADKERKMLFKKAKSAGWSDDELKEFLDGSYGIQSTREIPVDKFKEIMSYID